MATAFAFSLHCCFCTPHGESCLPVRRLPLIVLYRVPLAVRHCTCIRSLSPQPLRHNTRARSCAWKPRSAHGPLAALGPPHAFAGTLHATLSPAARPPPCAPLFTGMSWLHKVCLEIRI